MIDSKTLLDSLRGESNIKQQTTNNRILTTNMVSDSPRRGEKSSTEVNLCEGLDGPEDKSSQDRTVVKEKALGIGSDHKPLTLSDIAYAALTLYRPNPKKLQDNRRKVNLDLRVGESTTFNKLCFALTQKDSEFYANLPDNWRDLPPYATAFDFYRELKTLKMPAWLGKGHIRQRYRAGGAVKNKLRLGTAMVIWNNQGAVSGRCWIESAVFDFDFDQLIDNSAWYVAKSEPFPAQVVWDNSPWL